MKPRLQQRRLVTVCLGILGRDVVETLSRDRAQNTVDLLFWHNVTH